MDIVQGEYTATSPTDQENIQMHTEDDKKKCQEEAGMVPSTQTDNTERNVAPKATTATCKPVAAERLTVRLPAESINARIQYMKDHALIGKFIGFWPTWKALRGWITATWKPKGHFTLHLGPKGFFTTDFNCIEDRNRVLDGGPYFFNAVGLYLRDWIARFDPAKEDAQLRNNGEQQRAAQRNKNARELGKQQMVENSATLHGEELVGSQHATDSRAGDTKTTGDTRDAKSSKYAAEGSSVGTQPVRGILRGSKGGEVVQVCMPNC